MVSQAWLSADSYHAWPCRGHSLVFHLRLFSKLLPAKALTFLAEMFRKGNAAVIFGDGKLQVCIYRHWQFARLLQQIWPLASWNSSVIMYCVLPFITLKKNCTICRENKGEKDVISAGFSDTFLLNKALSNYSGSKYILWGKSEAHR